MPPDRTNKPAEPALRLARPPELFPGAHWLLLSRTGFAAGPVSLMFGSGGRHDGVGLMKEGPT